MEWWPRFTIWNDDQGFHMEWSYCMTKVSNALRRFPMPLETLVILLQGLLTVMDLVEVHWKPCGGPMDLGQVDLHNVHWTSTTSDVHDKPSGPLQGFTKHATGLSWPTNQVCHDQGPLQVGWSWQTCYVLGMLEHCIKTLVYCTYRILGSTRQP